MSKRYALSIIEYGVMNPIFYGLRSGRIEVFDRDAVGTYNGVIDEGDFLMPEELVDGFREIFDGYESDLPIRIHLDMFKYPDEEKKFYG